MNKLSVAILAQEDNDRLRRTLDSVYALSDIDGIDVVLVDNGSAVPISTTLTSYPRIKIIRNETDTGYSAGKNLAVSNTEGDYILLLDDDIVLPSKNYLNDIVYFYKKLPKVAFLGLLLIDEGQEKTRYHGMEYTWYGLNFFRKSIALDEAGLKHGKEISSYHGGAVFFSKDVWNKLGGYDTYQPIMHDDFDISARAKLFGYKNYLYSEDAVVHTGKFKDLDKKRFATKYKYFYSGLSGSIIKNFPITEVPLRLIGLTLFSLLLATALVYKKRNILVFFAFMYSYYFFASKLVYLIHQRIVFRKVSITHD